MLRRIAIGCLAASLAGMAAEARAEVTIYAQDTSLSAGGFGYLNLYIVGASSDLFDTYQVALAIVPMSGSGTIEFAPNSNANIPPYPDANAAANGMQPYLYLFPSDWTSASPTTATNYIFPNDSLYSALGQPGGDYPVTYNSDAGHFMITDSSLLSAYAPASDAAPTSGNPGTLLASLLIQDVIASPGATFSVQLLFDSSSPHDDGTTYFSNSGTDLIDVAPSFGSASGFSGTITINAVVVPEPSAVVSAMLAIVTIGGLAGARRIRSRKAA